LGYFQVYGNYLSGTIPTSIFNISSIYFFVAQNQLHAQLPPMRSLWKYLLGVLTILQDPYLQGRWHVKGLGGL
jgi:hypothetical protein